MDVVFRGEVGSIPSAHRLMVVTALVVSAISLANAGTRFHDP